MKRRFKPRSVEAGAKSTSLLHPSMVVQPWKPGIHIQIAHQIGCKPNEVHAAIQRLIAEGKRKPQKDGVVFDTTGEVLAIDQERVALPVNTSDAIGQSPNSTP